MPGILIVGSSIDGAMSDAALEAVGVALELGRGPVFGALIGSNIARAVESFARAGLGELFVVDDAKLAPYCAELQVAAAAAIIERCAPDLVLFPQTPDAAEWVPLLAGRVGAALATGCTRLALDGDRLMATRPVCGGALLAEYEFARPLRFVTLAPGVSAPAESDAPCTITPMALPTATPRTTVLEELPESAGDGPDLKTARIVVSGGLGLGARENWRLVEAAAAALGAAVGASRAAVELGWAPSTRQVGFSGQKISPDLYIAVGISGAVHHLAGLAGAKTIVAINKDPEAGIFRAARFGVVGDAREIVPAFVARLNELRAGQG